MKVEVPINRIGLDHHLYISCGRAGVVKQERRFSFLEQTG